MEPNRALMGSQSLLFEEFGAWWVRRWCGSEARAKEMVEHTGNECPPGDRLLVLRAC